MDLYRNYFKRILDVIISFIAFCIFSPVFLIAALLLFFSNKGKPFFFQTRPGKNEKLFRIIKFKTMNDKRSITGELLPDVDRITFMGKLIRKLSIDEIPQLINVIKGDMSLVGPRPLLTEYLNLYDVFQKRRHEVRPGITGWAQVNGRNAISWQQKFEYDVYYVDHLSFVLDIKILFLTFVKILQAKGISADGFATMEKFTGN
jgi:undecaprenyl phosphate N,N'-diacetylbacillosamine 1-phosphate transferase